MQPEPPAPSDPHAPEVTRLLVSAREDAGAQAELLAVVYDNLRAIAHARMRTERAGHTLDATALVHEAYVRLLAGQEVDWQNRAHFFRVAAECMRRVLVDHARARKAEKRGGRADRLPLSVVDLADGDDPDRVLALHEALEAFSAEEPRGAEIVKLRFFGGLSVEATADMLGLSVRTVLREWAFARTRIFQLMQGEAPEAAP